MKNPTLNHVIFDGPGEMRALCRQFDWSASPLGPVSAWPQSLRTAAQMVLASPFPNIVLWGSDFIQIYNDGYRELMDKQHPRGLGQSNEACWPEVWHINQPIYKRVLRGESFSFENSLYPLERAGKLEDVWLTLAYSPVLDESEKVGGVLVTVFDTTATILEEKRRREAEEASRAADRRKDEFLAMLAHELRNPIATVRNGLNFLEMENDNIIESKKIISMMNRQVGHLTHMVDDLLDVSRVSQDKIELRKEQLELSELVRAAVEAMRIHYDGCGKKLSLTTPSELLIVEGDATRLTQVITNLLTNGLRYTDEAGKVSVTLEAVDNQALLRVVDDGIGMTKEQMETIFELFVQADKSLARSKGGLGIGLTLVKRLVHLHGGRVVARSAGLGKGSEFEVSLPLKRHDQDVQGISEAIGRPSAGYRILIIDDNEDSGYTLSMLLRLQGYETLYCVSGQQGIDIAETFNPALILCDIGMPDMDGYETCQRIRLKPWGESVVLIALTGYGQDEDRRRAYDAGFNSHLLKPVEINELLVYLENLKVHRT